MKAKTKKVLTGITALVLTAAISAGGTFAYLTRLTEKRANNFTFKNAKLNAMLTEPLWDDVVDYEYDKDGIHPVYEDADDPVYGYGEVEDTENPGQKKRVKIKYKPDELNSFDDDDWDEVDDPDLKKWFEENKGQDGKVTWEDYDQPEDDTLGRIKAQNMIPNTTAPKNPFITNIGEIPEWVAAKVTFVYADGSDAYGKTPGQKLSDTDFAYVQKIIEIDWPVNTAKAADETINGASKVWYYAGDTTTTESTPITALTKNGSDYSSEMIFYYNTVLAQNDETAPIFNAVHVAETALKEDIAALEMFGGFAIYIEGYAVQKDAFDEPSDWVHAYYTTDKATFGSDATSFTGADVSGNGITAGEHPTEPTTVAAGD